MNNGIFNNYKFTYILAFTELNIEKMENLGPSKIPSSTLLSMKRLWKLTNLLRIVEYLFIFRKNLIGLIK